MKRHEIYPYFCLKQGGKILAGVRRDRLPDLALAEDCRMRWGGRGPAMYRLIKHGDPFWVGAVVNHDQEYLKKLSAMEWAFGRMDNPTLFFDDPDMIPKIEKVKTQGLQPEHIQPRWGTFAVAMPKGLRIGKRKAHPLLVSVGTSRAFVEVQNAMMADIPADISGPTFELEEGGGETVFLSMAISLGCGGADLFVTKWGEFFETLTLSDEEWEARLDECTSEATQNIRRHARFLAGLIVFMDMFPGRILPGLPASAPLSEAKNHGQKSIIRQKVTPMTAHWPIDNTTGKPTILVGAHWRHYTHPSKCVKTGGKPWWGRVKAHEKGAKMTPYTVTAPQRSKASA